MFLLTSLGSNSCLATDMMMSKTMMAIPKLKSPFMAQMTAQGTITVPDPRIGRASTNPINKAINNGYGMLNPVNCKIYNPIKEMIKEMRTKVASAFK